MPISMNEILKATGLTRKGQLLDATRLIQRALGLAARTPPRPPQTPPMPAIGMGLAHDAHNEIMLPEAPPVAPIETPPQPAPLIRPAAFTVHEFKIGRASCRERV